MQKIRYSSRFNKIGFRISCTDVKQSFSCIFNPITWYHYRSWCHNASLSPISCPKPLKQSCSGMGRISEVSYLCLYLILPRSAKISILSHLGDKREFIFVSYLRYFFKLSSPFLVSSRT